MAAHAKVTAEDLPVCPTDLDFSIGSWLVLRTRARQEKAVARYFASQQLPYFLPLIPRVCVTRGRKFRSRVPLFPGYVFLSGRPDDAFGAVSNKRVCQIIPVIDQAGLIHELTQIRRAVESEAPMDLYPFATIGRRCRIRIGPLAGVEGMLIERRSVSRFVLQVNMIGQGASLEVDADLLEPLHDEEEIPIDSGAP